MSPVGLQSAGDHWTSAFLSAAYSPSTTYPRQSAVVLSLDQLRHLPSPAPLQRFSHVRVAHPATAFTIHHAAQSDLTVPGWSVTSSTFLFAMTFNHKVYKNSFECFFFADKRLQTNEIGRLCFVANKDENLHKFASRRTTI